MQQDRYVFEKEPEKHSYEFYSEGAQGRIKKVVEYTRLVGIKTEAYNLSFGDWDYLHGRLDDKIITNNGDRDKVLATVAYTVVDFIRNHPSAFVFAQGSTPGRTRLYQISINRLLVEVQEEFNVRGFVDNQWQIFRPGMNYTAFLLELK